MEKTKFSLSPCSWENGHKIRVTYSEYVNIKFEINETVNLRINWKLLAFKKIWLKDIFNGLDKLFLIIPS